MIRTSTLDRLRAAERLHLPFLQRPQELRLRGQREVDNLVEEEASAIGKRKLSRLALMRTGERALLVAEQLRLDQRVGDRAAVHGDERLLAPAAQMMDRPGHELLARAGFALDEDRERRVGHLFDLLDDLLHLPARPHQPPQWQLLLLGPPAELAMSIARRNEATK